MSIFVLITSTILITNCTYKESQTGVSLTVQILITRPQCMRKIGHLTESDLFH
jgi:hypothetical protein